LGPLNEVILILKLETSFNFNAKISEIYYKEQISKELIFNNRHNFNAKISDSYYTQRANFKRSYI